MNSSVFLTRLTMLRDAAAVAPLINVLVPEGAGESAAVTHRLMWTLMPEHVRQAQPSRDETAPRSAAPFLWRDDGTEGRYYLLGPQPVTSSPFFNVETKLFEPALVPGDRLAFTLRANATVDRKVGVDADGSAIRKRSDVVMDHLHAEESDAGTVASRADRREEAAEVAARSWMSSQGRSHGFQLTALHVGGYRVLRLPRPGRRATIGILDLEGILEVGNPDLFVPRLIRGFGRAKAFGCGLMLVRRAR